MLTNRLVFTKSIIFEGELDEFDLEARVELIEEAFVQRGLRSLIQCDTLTPVSSKDQGFGSRINRVWHGS